MSAPASSIDRTHLRWDMEEDEVTLYPLVWKHKVRWRDSGEGEDVDVYVPREDAWRQVGRANWATFLALYESEVSLQEAFRLARERLPHRSRQQVRFLLQKTLGKMLSWGYVEFVLPPDPVELGGRYPIVRQLGRGGMGVVWLARDTLQADELVAIKHAWNGPGRFRTRESALRDEHRIMALLDHPLIVKARDSFEIDGRFHLVRDYLDARPLTGIDDARRQDPALRASLTRQAAEVIEHVFQRGYYYLDLKPANFFVDDASRLICGDLGLCKPLVNGERIARGVGTIAYSAPEVLRREVATEASLVYTLGLFRWELAAGRAPRAKAEPARLLTYLPESTPASERAFLEATLQPRAADRPQTILDAVAMLE